MDQINQIALFLSVNDSLEGKFEIEEINFKPNWYNCVNAERQDILSFKE